MKKKEKRGNFSGYDKFDRKQKKAIPAKQKGTSKHKYSIYDDFDEEELTNYFEYDD